MFTWAKQQLANVAGTQEPIYGPSGIQPVSEQTKESPYTELTKQDLKWVAMTSTCVETQTFYFTSDSGHLGMAQVIYSNVAGIHTSCQFNAKIFYPDETKTPPLWSSTPLNNFDFDEEKLSFLADNCSIQLSPDGDVYTIKSAADENAMVNIKVTRTAPGFVAGKNGTSFFGTDPANPWGRMRHAFWPTCSVEGSIITKGGEVDFKGRGLYIMALQGMKPHHAAARWNFINFQSPSYSAILMEYTTPPSYGKTVVTVGCIARNGVLELAHTQPAIVHADLSEDDKEWPEPRTIEGKWRGSGGKISSAELSGSLGTRLAKVDVMAEIPGVIKALIAQTVGTKPYIYQYAPKMTLKITEADGDSTVTKEEEGRAFIEATFIS